LKTKLIKRNCQRNKQNNKEQCCTNFYIWAKWIYLRNSFLIKSTRFTQCFVDPSIQLQNKPSYNRQPNNNWQANNNRGRYNNNYYQNNNRSNYYRANQNKEQTQAQKREQDETVNQPANKVTRLNNINEDHFLDHTPTGECLI